MVEDTAIDRTRPWAMAMPMRPTWPLVRASVQMAPAPMKHRANVPINSATHSFQAIRIADTSLGFAGGTRGNGPAGWSGHNLPEACADVNPIELLRVSSPSGVPQRNAAHARSRLAARTLPTHMARLEIAAPRCGTPVTCGAPPQDAAVMSAARHGRIVLHIGEELRTPRLGLPSLSREP